MTYYQLVRLSETPYIQLKTPVLPVHSSSSTILLRLCISTLDHTLSKYLNYCVAFVMCAYVQFVLSASIHYTL